MEAEENALKEHLGNNFIIYGHATYQAIVGPIILSIYLPPDYPAESPPEISSSLVSSSGKPSDSSLTSLHASIDAQVIHLWESSLRSPVLMDIIEWLEETLESHDSSDSDEERKGSDGSDGAKDEWSPDPERDLVIYTWGDQMQKKAPELSEKNFNAKCLNCRGGGIDLRTMNGTWPELQAKVQTSSAFAYFRRRFIEAIEKRDLKAVSVNCSKGRHRCASFAEVMRLDYPKLVVEHLSIKVTTTPTDLCLRTKNRKSKR